MKPRPAQIHPDGATDGQVITYTTAVGYPHFADLPAPTTAYYAPLTTDVAGVPDLVWDADNSLILTEVPIP